MPFLSSCFGQRVITSGSDIAVESPGRPLFSSQSHVPLSRGFTPSDIEPRGQPRDYDRLRGNLPCYGLAHYKSLGICHDTKEAHSPCVELDQPITTFAPIHTVRKRRKKCFERRLPKATSKSRTRASRGANHHVLSYGKAYNKSLVDLNGKAKGSRLVNEQDSSFLATAYNYGAKEQLQLPNRGIEPHLAPTTVDMREMRQATQVMTPTCLLYADGSGSPGLNELSREPYLTGQPISGLAAGPSCRASYVVTNQSTMGYSPLLPSINTLEHHPPNDSRDPSSNLQRFPDVENTEAVRKVANRSLTQPDSDSDIWFIASEIRSRSTSAAHLEKHEDGQMCQEINPELDDSTAPRTQDQVAESRASSTEQDLHTILQWWLRWSDMDHAEVISPHPHIIHFSKGIQVATAESVTRLPGPCSLDGSGSYPTMQSSHQTGHMPSKLTAPTLVAKTAVDHGQCFLDDPKALTNRVSEERSSYVTATESISDAESGVIHHSNSHSGQPFNGARWPLQTNNAAGQGVSVQQRSIPWQTEVGRNHTGTHGQGQAPDIEYRHSVDNPRYPLPGHSAIAKGLRIYEPAPSKPRSLISHMRALMRTNDSGPSSCEEQISSSATLKFQQSLQHRRVASIDDLANMGRATQIWQRAVEAERLKRRQRRSRNTLTGGDSAKLGSLRKSRISLATEWGRSSVITTSLGRDFAQDLQQQDIRSLKDISRVSEEFSRRISRSWMLDNLHQTSPRPLLTPEFGTYQSGKRTRIPTGILPPESWSRFPSHTRDERNRVSNVEGVSINDFAVHNTTADGRTEWITDFDTSPIGGLASHPLKRFANSFMKKATLKFSIRPVSSLRDLRRGKMLETAFERNRSEAGNDKWFAKKHHKDVTQPSEILITRQRSTSLPAVTTSFP